LQQLSNRKAHPDEKGTESCIGIGTRLLDLDRKAHPDEKGTESQFQNRAIWQPNYRSQGPSR